MRWARGMPPEVQAMLGGERLLAHGELAGRGGGHVVASDVALHWSGSSGGNHRVAPDAEPAPASGAGNRIAWEDIITASWSEGFLDLLCRDPGPAGAREVRLRLAEPGRLPEVVRERVMFTVLASQQVVVGPPGQPPRKVVLTARRPGSGSGVRWDVVFDPAGGPLSPAQSRAVDEAIDRWAGQLGIGPSTGPVARIARVDPP